MDKPLRVLIVEDSEDDALLVIRELECGGYDTTFERVETAEDMTAALEKQSWDIIIADYRLPHFSAPEALELFHQSDLDLPFIVVSGTIGEETAIATMKAGAHDYLMKGNLKRLTPAIERELNEAEVRRQHRQAEEALRASDEQYRDLYENAPCAYFSISAVDGSVLGCNSGALRLFGYDRETVMRMKIFDLYDDKPQNVSKAQEVFKRFKAGETIRDVELEMKQKDGHPVWISLSVEPVVDRVGNVTESRSIVVDITVRKQAEEELLKSERRYRTLFEDSIDAIVITSREGKLLDVNQAALDLLGYTKVEIMGMNFRELYVDPSNGKRFQQHIDQKGFVANFEVKLRKKDGTELDSLFTVSTKRADDGSIVGYQGFIRDITDQKKLEAQFLQAQKMEAIGTLAGGIAHDFNNILMAMLGHCDLAKTKLAEDSEAIDNLNRIKNAGDRATRLIQQILAFGRMGEQERIALSLTPLIKEALKFLKSTIPTSIEIRDYIEADPGIIEADATQIHQIVMNLCTNAEHAMREEGGTLDVKLIRVEVDRQTALQHHELHTGPHVRLMVSDTGCGMDLETLEHIFDPYFTTKEVGEGTGLGLSVVHGIVETHNGAITVESERGKGTTFHVYFPVIEKEEKIQEEDEGPLPTGNERILFVDDEEMIVDIAKEMLGKLGYDIVTEKSSVEALELFRADPDRFDLVITDMTMPKMTGDQLARELMKVRPDIPIILCTGFNPKISEEKSKELGIKAFAMKPLVGRDMANTIRKALGD